MTKKTEILRREQHPTPDMFYTSQIRIVSGKMVLDMLEHPFWSLQSKSRDMSTVEYASQDGSVKLKILPSAIGRVTMKDADFVTYLIAKLVKMKDDGEIKAIEASDGEIIIPEPEIIIEVADYLEFVSREKSGQNYRGFEPMLRRLSGTTFKIEYRNQERPKDDYLAILSNEYSVWKTKDGKEPVSFKIKPTKWFLENVLGSSRYLALERPFFLIKRDTHKRYYQLGRKHAYEGMWEARWEIFVNKVRGHTTGAELTRFRSKLRKEFKDNGGYIDVLRFRIYESSDKRKVIIRDTTVYGESERITGNNDQNAKDE